MVLPYFKKDKWNFKPVQQSFYLLNFQEFQVISGSYKGTRGCKFYQLLPEKGWKNVLKFCSYPWKFVS